MYDGSLEQGERRRLAYDAGDEEDDRIILGSKSNHTKNVRPLDSPPLYVWHLSLIYIFQSQTSNSPSIFTFHDGRPVLAGFVLSEKPVMEDKWSVLPLLIFVPLHILISI